MTSQPQGGPNGQKVYAIGVSMTKFCRPGTPNSNYVKTAADATVAALADAGLDYSHMKAAVVSYCYGAPTCGQRVLHEVVNRSNQAKKKTMGLKESGEEAGPTGIPVFNTNNNCSSASAALYLARTLVKGSGHGNDFGAVLALGFEEMERGLSEPFPDKESPIGCQIDRLFKLGAKEGKISPHMNNFTSDIIKVFSHAALEYESTTCKRPGSSSPALPPGSLQNDWALIANKNHRHGAANPKSMMFGRPTPPLEKVQSKGLLVAPITSGMSAPTANGAAACVLVSEAFLRTLSPEVQHRAVEIAGQSMCSDLPSSFRADTDKQAGGTTIPPFWALAGGHMAQVAAERALTEADTKIQDVGVIEVHDCFSPNEVFMYEALGMCPKGTGIDFFKTQGKWTLTSGGREQYKLQGQGFAGGEKTTVGPVWVVNPSGGLESKGHPIGATGLGQCFELVTHLRGEAGARQVEPRPVCGLQHNFGFNGGAVVTVYKRSGRGGLGSAGLFQVPRPLNESQLRQLAPLRGGWSNFQEGDIGLVFNETNGNLTGVLPRELRGTFFRNGPGLNTVYGTPLAHPIDGDGLVARLAFTGDGTAYLNTAFVQTSTHQEELAAQKLLFPGQMGTRVPPENLLDADGKKKKRKFKFRDPAHTNTYYWGGKLLACHEYVLPHVMDPQTLKTVGPSSLGDALGANGPFAAHFRVDHHQQRLVTFGFRPANPMMDEPPSLAIAEFDPEWNIVRKYKLSIEGLNYSHDLAVTANYYIFQMTPFVKVTEEAVTRILEGKELPGEQMGLNPDLPCRLVVIARATGEVVTQRDMAEKCHIYHFGNAWEEKQKQEGQPPILHLQATCLPPAFNMKFLDGLWLSNANQAPGQFMSLTLDLAKKEAASKMTLAEAASNEFPVVHPDLHCGPAKPIDPVTQAELIPRFSYLMGNGAGDTVPFNAVLKHDALGSNQGRQVYMVPGCVLGEPVFAPRRDSSSSTTPLDQDDGWVIVQVYRPHAAEGGGRQQGGGKDRGGSTEFHVLDAKKLDAGPVAVLSLGCTLPYGFHGTWSDRIFAPLPSGSKSKL